MQVSCNTYMLPWQVISCVSCTGSSLVDGPTSSSYDKAAAGSRPTTDLHDMQGLEDTSILEDLAEAEEEYDRPEQVTCPFSLCKQYS